ncbi:hypothetical protein EJ08DRAFT_611616 [Tothia fuscella]|uniref:CENP-V/GFA domain-containing protein n=1 Tax=Tothia fuscella TaxID=1048955 RepID=A0A9P4NSS0_9PEZI|nr:hypothetical protein EJ08DRAFT_611616 [Tothia fuscella]
MPKGSCLCGKSGVEFKTYPEFKILCYCTDCKKVSGSIFGCSILIPKSEVTTKGSLKQVTVHAESGRPITNSFCPDCGTTLFREGPILPDTIIIKTGVLDDAVDFENLKPMGEAYTCNRPEWVTHRVGEQYVGAPPGL